MIALGDKRPATVANKGAFLSGTLLADPALAEAMGLRVLNIPEHLHAVAARRQIGDVNTANLLCEVLDNQGITLAAGDRILDFGCSTGRLVNVLAAYFDRQEVWGCDPRKNSIDWASEAIPSARFFHSTEAPPTPLEPGFLSLVVAISVWSHFSAERALAWFDEMHRVLAPGGHIVFTTHGYISLDHFLGKNAMRPDMAEKRRETMDAGGYHFMPSPAQGEQKELEVAHWGVAFVSPDWYRKMLVGKYEVLAHYPGRLLANQDAYLLRKLG